MTEASCAKCHKQQVYIPKAEKLNVAYATYERAGCYACHKTKGFDTEHAEARADPDEDRLEADAGLGEELDPQSARGQADDLDAALLVQLEQQRRRTRAQRGRDQRDRRLPVRERREARVRGEEPARGDAKRGEKIVKSIGCQGCHVVGEGSREAAVLTGPSASRSRTSATRPATSGSTTGSAIPSTTTRPPTCRPAPDRRQVADVATYLMGLKGAAGDAAKAQPIRRSSTTSCSTTLKAVLPIADAQAELAKLNAEQKQLELGKRAINRYGCFSCHDIKGFEKAQAIGTDLSRRGHQARDAALDFAFITDIPHTSKLGWFRAKLHDPRDLRQGRVLQPLDKLRMPNFDLTTSRSTGC
jgi:mono/diheme cytochrome c family protein